MNGGPSAELAPWIERLARVGYAAKAVLYITVGYLAAEAGLGTGGRVTDTHGALRVVHQASHGPALLLLIAAGLTGYAVWRLVEAVVDPERRGTNAKGIALRLGFAIRGAFHGLLGITAFRLVLGDGSGASGDEPHRWTERAFDLPGGDLLVGLAAGWVAGYGVYQFYRAATPKMQRHLQLSELPDRVRGWVLGVSRFGIAARGLVFCLIGFFFARAALRHDAGQAGGIRESLRTLSELGRWPFVLVAFGLLAYGIYELVNARYRRIRAV
ncbi:MAG TPA: DUF1206 domain-containing protein [Gemmatimonadales bacterium]|nr:DUF1206 domain-containing protein [Gemmatimonadales bacterium]